MTIVKNLLDNYENNTCLKETLQEIKNQIKRQAHPLIRDNLKLWKRKYEVKIKKFQTRKIIDNSIIESKNAINLYGNLTEKFIEDFIYLEGLRFGEINIEKFERQKILGKEHSINKSSFNNRPVISYIGKIDLLGICDNKLYIIEIKSCYAKSSVIGQSLAYYQYLVDEYKKKDIEIIIIALGYTQQYKLAIRSLDKLKIKIHTVEYKLLEDKIIFEVLDKKKVF